MKDKLCDNLTENTQLVNEIYKDALQPTIKKAGKMGEDLLKFVALPFTFLGLTAEQLEEKYRTFLINAINKVPEEKRESPKPAIVSPLLDYVKFLFEDKDSVQLINMFSDLLSKSLNRDEKDNVHVSYVHTLLQLGHLEAEILSKMYEQEIDNFGIIFRREANTTERCIKVFVDEAEYVIDEEEAVFFYEYVLIIDDNIDVPNSVFLESLNILRHHNLISSFKINKYKNEDKYSLEKHNQNNVEKYDVKRSEIVYHLTQYGRDFMSACIAPINNPHAVIKCSKCNGVYTNINKDGTCPFCNNKYMNIE